MCAGGKEDEFETFKRLITEVYPSGFVSIVSDTWDYWKVITDCLPGLKDEMDGLLMQLKKLLGRSWLCQRLLGLMRCYGTSLVVLSMRRVIKFLTHTLVLSMEIL